MPKIPSCTPLSTSPTTPHNLKLLKNKRMATAKEQMMTTSALINSVFSCVYPFLPEALRPFGEVVFFPAVLPFGLPGFLFPLCCRLLDSATNIAPCHSLTSLLTGPRIRRIHFSHLGPVIFSIQKNHKKCNFNILRLPISGNLSVSLSPVNHLIQFPQGFLNPAHLVDESCLHCLFPHQHGSQVPGQHLCIVHQVP